MKPNSLLNSVVFQLTPTRTRCDLIIIANEKKEKIASGLLNPFVAHLKVAQDQIAKGGYSILLEPEPDSDKTWFTKATVERFVRFVSTPEILERVYTIESEILQIEEAISIQRSSSLGLSSAEDHQGKSLGSFEGKKSLPDGGDEKAIVLYKPGPQSPDANGSCLEGNSKIQLLTVMETRKTVLCKEQGMAFARARAAGFDIDQMAPLISFAECFGASRLLEACSRFMILWKKKHETGQWLEVEAAEGRSTHSKFSGMDASGIVLCDIANKNDSNSELASDNYGKSGSDSNAAHNSVPTGQPEYTQGQFPHMVFPPWPVHSSPGGPPVFQAYPVQGMPYYQTYTRNSPFYPLPHPLMEHYHHQAGQKGHPLDDRDAKTESEIREMDRIKSKNDMELSKEVSHSSEPQKRERKPSKKQSGVVVIRNINYITSKGKKSDSESMSVSDSATDTDNEDSEAGDDNVSRKNSLRSSTRKGGNLKSLDDSLVNDREVSESVRGTADGDWQAFQNCLLRGTNEDTHSASENLFAIEKASKFKRQENVAPNDLLALGGRDQGEMHETRMREIDRISGSTSHWPRGSGDEVLFSRRNNDISGYEDVMNMQYTGTNGRRILSRAANDEYIVGSEGNQLIFGNSSDPLATEHIEGSIDKMDKELSCGMSDETFMVPFRSISIDQVGPGDRTAISVDSEFPSVQRKSDSISDGTRNHVNYEPVDLSMMPERGIEKRPIGYDPALDYEMQVFGGTKNSGSKEKGGKEVTNIKGSLKKSEKDRRLKVSSNSLDKQRTGGPIRKVKPKTNTLEDARIRAERLRSYKADLQKIKKEKEEAEQKRLEALKLERQKRIAARGSSTSAKVSAVSLQTKSLPIKLSPVANRGSKFSDSEPGLSSPLQRSKIGTSLRSSEPRKASKVNKSSEISPLPGDRLSRSASSLSEPKREKNSVTPDSNASMARIRRLSFPKKVGNYSLTPTKVRSAEAALKRRFSDGPERNKISAIINLDKSKAATLPQLKIKTPKAPLNVGQNKSAVKVTQNFNGMKPSGSEENAVVLNNLDTTKQSDVEDNPIVEKNVVMLECEKPAITILHSPVEMMGQHHQQRDSHDPAERSGMISEFAAINAPPLPMDGVDRHPIPSECQNQSHCYEEVKTDYSKDHSGASNPAAGKPYQAPHARVSSSEDPCIKSSEYGKAPKGSSEMVSRVEDTCRARVPDVKTIRMENNHEAYEKTRVKESSKGIRRLLKFGKKNNSSTAVDQSFESDSATFEQDNMAKITASSSEVHTLKNLISQDETPSGGNVLQKTSRHFSLLLPFRSKTSENRKNDAI